MEEGSRKFSSRDIAFVGLMVALIEVSKFALSGLPNIELTSFWLIMFTLHFGWLAVWTVPVFTLIEGALYGVSLWWVMYLCAWSALVAVTLLLKKKATPLLMAVVSGLFGLCFGAICAVPYIFLGLGEGGLGAGLRTAVSWWITGLPWDLVHGIGNFVIMLVLYKPVSRVMRIIYNGSAR